MGPSLAAFSPLDGFADQSALPTTDWKYLVSYHPPPGADWFSSGSPTTYNKCERNINYTNYFEQTASSYDYQVLGRAPLPEDPLGYWNVNAGKGYWTWNDSCSNSIVWIDLPTKHGVIVGATVGMDRNWYQGSTLNADSGAHEFMIYNPTDLGSVASGSVEPWEIQATTRWMHEFPNVSYPLYSNNGTSGPNQGCLQWGRLAGMAYEPTQSRLYCCTKLNYGGSITEPLVHVYEVA
jgi:hypothetical protein